MELYKVNDRLYSDIISSKLPDAYFLNQENDINIPNTHKKIGWRHIIDGFRVIKENEYYKANYTYDRGAVKNHKIKPLCFNSYSKSSGLNFLDFINSVINGDEKIFLQFRGLEVFDLRKKIFEIGKIEIRNTVVDNILISLLSRYFSKLKEIEFINCIIKNECNFDKIKCDIDFKYSVIENIRVFNDTFAKICIHRTKIEKISNATINSKELRIECVSDIDVKDLFLKCNFSFLENFIVYPEVSSELKGYSYEDKFMYIASSAPNLENISISGKLREFDFLSDIKNLLRCEVRSIYDLHSSFYPETTSSVEKEKFKKRNLDAYNIEKILCPDLADKFILGRIEIERVKKLAQFNKLLSYSSDELKQLLSGIDFLKYSIKNNIENGEITKFYELYFDTLYLRNTDNEKDVRLGLDETYGMLDGYIYLYNIYHELNSNSKIVKGKNYIYNYDGKPIIFKNSQKKIATTKEALEFRDKHSYQKEWSYDDHEKYGFDKFLEFMKKLKENPEDITIGNIIDSSIITDYNVKIEDLIKLGEGGKYIAGILENYYRLDNSYDDIEKKHYYYRNLLEELIIFNYDKFEMDEKIVLYLNNIKYKVRSNRFYVEPDIYDLKSSYNDDLLESINMKTSGLYIKYFNMIKLTYNQYNISKKKYDLEVNEEHIKKLKID